MEREKIAQKVIKKIEFVTMAKADLSSNLKDDLGMDSLDMIELVMQLEKSFRISIYEREFEKFERGTVSDVVDFVQSKL